MEAIQVREWQRYSVWEIRDKSGFVYEDRQSIERPKTAEYFKAYSRRAGIWLRLRNRNLRHIPARPNPDFLHRLWQDSCKFIEIKR